MVHQQVHNCQLCENGPGQLVRAGEFYGPVKASRKGPGYWLSTLAHGEARQIPSHCHDWPFVSYLVRGAYCSTTRNSALELNGNSALLFPPWYEHRDEIGKDGGAFFCLQFNPRIFDGFPGNKAKHLDAMIVKQPAAMQALNHVLISFLSGKSDFELETLIWDFLANLIVGDNNPIADQEMQRICQLLHDADPSVITLDSLAYEAGMHRSTLVRQFRRHTGCSIGEYRALVRRQQAFSALIATDARVSDIGLEAGYSDQSHMTRDFSHSLGLPPVRLRRAADHHGWPE